MSPDGRSRAQVSAVAAWLGALAVIGACAKVSSISPDGGPSSGQGGGGGGAVTGSGGGTSTGKGGSGSGTGGNGSTCTPVQCMQPTGQYCQMIGDGCGKTIDCGACPTGKTCEKGICVTANCTSMACGTNCGMIGDGCGRALTCPDCAGGQTCMSGVCVTPGCVPTTCNFTGGQYCGTIGDGCGSSQDCPACTNGTVCGGGGLQGVCGGGTCVPVTCTPAGGGHYCGVIGTGCGGTLDCGTCPDGMACGSGGQPGVCPGGPATTCQRLQCQIPTCTGTATTSISGTIYDPAGRTPLYNVVVYVPNAPLDPVPIGASCDKCSVKLTGQPIATALSGMDGKFKLTGVPAGANIPLVIQVGKWRRQVTIANVTGCVDNPITDVNMTRLPRTEAEGNIPKIGLTTGGSDALECFLRKVGIADSEFTLATGTGRVNLYTGGDTGGNGAGASSFAPALGGGTFANASTLWGSTDKMLGYDILMFSCEGSHYPAAKDPYLANVKKYIDSGGRLFNSHLHEYWLRMGPAPLPTTAVYAQGNVKLAPDNNTPLVANVDQTFPKGMAFGQWLVNVGASTTAGQLTMYSSSQVIATAVVPPTQRWIYYTPITAVDYLSFNTPVEAVADNQCGRVVLTDIHVKDAVQPAGGHRDDSDPSKPFPTACTSTFFSAQEQALEFLFFDLSACVQPDTTMPQPPVVPPPGVPMMPPGPVSKPPPVPPPPPPPPPPTVQ